MYYSEKHFLLLTGSKILSFNRTCPSVSLALNLCSFFWLKKNHWLVISNIGEEMDTVCIYDSMQNRPDGECISLVARYVQCPDSHITIKVMNVQLQDNGYACGELAVAFATSLIDGEDPTQLHYKELRSHFKNCVDTYSITPSSFHCCKPSATCCT